MYYSIFSKTYQNMEKNEFEIIQRALSKKKTVLALYC